MSDASLRAHRPQRYGGQAEQDIESEGREKIPQAVKSPLKSVSGVVPSPLVLKPPPSLIRIHKVINGPYQGELVEYGTFISSPFLPLEVLQSSPRCGGGEGFSSSSKMTICVSRGVHTARFERAVPNTISRLPSSHSSPVTFSLQNPSRVSSFSYVFSNARKKHTNSLIPKLPFIANSQEVDRRQGASQAACHQTV